jgi:hypothetical protein
MNNYHRIRTVGDVRDERVFADALAAARDAARARVEADRRAYIAEQLARYPQIGTLNSGKFYAFVGGRTMKHYVESKFLARVIDAIEANNR